MNQFVEMSSSAASRPALMVERPEEHSVVHEHPWRRRACRRHRVLRVILGSGVLAADDGRAQEKKQESGRQIAHAFSVYDLRDCVPERRLTRLRAPMRRVARRPGRRSQRAPHGTPPRRGPLRTPCRPAGRRRCARRGVGCRGCRLSRATTACRRRRHPAARTPPPCRRLPGLPSRARRRPQIESGQLAGRARRRVRVEDRDTVGTLDELHRRAPARVDFDRVRNAVADDEVDAVDADEAEFLGRPPGQRGCRVHERDGRHRRPRMFPQYWYPTAPKACSPTSCRETAERYGTPAGRNEHDRAGRPVDELLQIAAARQRVAALPAAEFAARRRTRAVSRATP